MIFGTSFSAVGTPDMGPRIQDILARAQTRSLATLVTGWEDASNEAYVCGRSRYAAYLDHWRAAALNGLSGPFDPAFGDLA